MIVQLAGLPETADGMNQLPNESIFLFLLDVLFLCPSLSLSVRLLAANYARLQRRMTIAARRRFVLLFLFVCFFFSNVSSKTYALPIVRLLFL